MRELKVLWVARHGSIFTQQTKKRKTDFGTYIEGPASIAFNLGDEVAKHLVDVHNQAVINSHLQDLRLGIISKSKFLELVGCEDQFDFTVLEEAEE